jgi:hypothetical protein
LLGGGELTNEINVGFGGGSGSNGGSSGGLGGALGGGGGGNEIGNISIVNYRANQLKYSI